MSILAYAYGGADAGRGLRRVLDRGGPVTLAVLLTLSSGATLVCGAGFGVSVTEASPLGAIAFGLVLAGAVQTTSASALRLWWRPRRAARSAPEVATSPSGIQATAYLRSRASLTTPLLTGTLFTAVAAGATLAAAQSGIWWAAALTAMTTAYGASTLAPFALGKVAAGGVFLTPAGVEHRWALSVASIPWSTYTFGMSATVLTARGTPRKTFGWFIPMDRVDRDGRDTIAIPATYLGPTAEQLLATIDACCRDPSLRSTLGTTAWLDLSRPPGITQH